MHACIRYYTHAGQFHSEFSHACTFKQAKLEALGCTSGKQYRQKITHGSTAPFLSFPPTPVLVCVILNFVYCHTVHCNTERLVLALSAGPFLHVLIII